MGATSWQAFACARTKLGTVRAKGRQPDATKYNHSCNASAAPDLCRVLSELMLQVPARQIAHVQRDGAVARGAHHRRLALQVPRRNLDRNDLR